MPVPTSITELSQTAGSNPPASSDSPTVTDDHFRASYSFIALLRDIKASIADVVLLTGNQTIAGIKTFSSNIVGNLTGNVSGTAANVTGTVALANGGTGQTTAAAAFTALKQAATDTATGVVELATASEAQAGTDTTRAVTPDNLSDTVLGMGQTAQNVFASRAFATNYTNSTGRTIYVSVTAIGSSSADIYMQLLTGGTQRARCSLSYQESGTWRFFYNSISWPVLAGEVYRVDVVGGSATLSLWSEIRT